MTIVEFLCQRLDEDEATAKAASRGPWQRDYHAAFMHGIKDADGRSLMGDGLMESPNVNHVVRHDPARVLREVEAKRAIVDRFAEICERNDEYAREDELRYVIRYLASAYQDHPDFASVWRA